MSDDDKDAELYPFTPPPPRPGAAPRQRRRSRLTKTAAGLAVILGAGAGGAAVASATSAGPGGSTPAASASASTTVPPREPGPVRRGFFPPGPYPGMEVPPGTGPMGMLGMGAAIHGSFVVKGPNGTYETIDTQYGTAEAVSSSSITVKSADGFSQTYVVGSSTIVFAEPNGIQSVKVGDTVSIQGLVSGSSINAERVLDVTQVKAHRAATMPDHPSWKGGPGGSGGPGGPGGSAA